MMATGKSSPIVASLVRLSITALSTAYAMYRVSRVSPGRAAEITNVYLLHRKFDLALFDGLNDLDLEIIPVIKRFSPQKLKQAEQLFHVVLKVAHQHGVTFRRPAYPGYVLGSGF